MNDRDEKLESLLRSQPLPDLSDEAKSRILADLASVATDKSAGVDYSLNYKNLTLPQTIWRTIVTHKIASVCIATATCAAVAFAIILPSLSSDGADRNVASQGSKQTEVAAAPKATGENAANKSGAARPLIFAQVASLDRQVVYQDLIVVAKYLDSTPAEPTQPDFAPDRIARFGVLRILKGKLDQDLLTVRLRGQPKDPEAGLIRQLPQPAVEELGGKEWILMVGHKFDAGETPYTQIFGADNEPRINAILAGPPKASGERPLEKQVADAEVIVVANYMDYIPMNPFQLNDPPESMVRLRVTNVLKGTLDEKSITTKLPNSMVNGNVNELARKDWILMLSPEYVAGKHIYTELVAIKEEPKVLSVLAASRTPSTSDAKTTAQSVPSGLPQASANRPFEKRVAEAEVIVVGTFLDSAPAQKRSGPPELLERFRVSRVLKGKFDKDTVTIQAPGGGPTGAKESELVGKEWILMLDPAFIAGKDPGAVGISTIKLESQVTSILAAAPASSTSDAKTTAQSAPAPSSGRAAARRTLKDRVVEAEVIVVATCLDSSPAEAKRPSDLPESLVRFSVSRVLKGKLDAATVTIQKPDPPIGAGVDELVGKEWILLLDPAFIAGKDRYAGIHTIKGEPEILSILSAEQKDQ
jgi:hypothetical protein